MNNPIVELKCIKCGKIIVKGSKSNVDQFFKPGVSISCRTCNGDFDLKISTIKSLK